MTSETDKRSFSIGDKTFEISYSHTIDHFHDHWPRMRTCPNLIISYEYLRTIEQAPPKDIHFLYGYLTKSDGQVLGYYYFQYKRFNARQSLNYNHAHTLAQKTANAIKRTVSTCLDAKGLVFGNLLVTGDHGVLFLDDDLSEDEKWNLNTEVLRLALIHSKENDMAVGFVLGKDFEYAAVDRNEIDWNSVNVQPNMVLQMDPDWDSMEKYLASMRSKYRKRINSALRKVSRFRFVDVDVDDIEANLDWIYSLYLEIVERAPFNMFVLDKNYFVEIKKNLGDLCDFTIVTDGDKLVAFQINLANGDVYDAHFLGYDHTMLKSHDLYLNLLLNTVEHAIKKNMQTIIFSRTAMQIKSSIGAEPEELFLYLAVKNKLLNRFVRTAFKRLNPPVVFDQRHPFKERREL